MMAIVDKSTWNIKLLHLQYMPSFHSIDAEGSIQAFIGASSYIIMYEYWYWLTSYLNCRMLLSYVTVVATATAAGISYIHINRTYGIVGFNVPLDTI